MSKLLNSILIEGIVDVTNSSRVTFMIRNGNEFFSILASEIVVKNCRLEKMEVGDTVRIVGHLNSNQICAEYVEIKTNGTWGGLAVQPENDEFEVISEVETNVCN